MQLKILSKSEIDTYRAMASSVLIHKTIETGNKLVTVFGERHNFTFDNPLIQRIKEKALSVDYDAIIIENSRANLDLQIILQNYQKRFAKLNFASNEEKYSYAHHNYGTGILLAQIAIDKQIPFFQVEKQIEDIYSYLVSQNHNPEHVEFILHYYLLCQKSRSYTKWLDNQQDAILDISKYNNFKEFLIGTYPVFSNAYDRNGPKAKELGVGIFEWIENKGKEYFDSNYELTQESIVRDTLKISNPIFDDMFVYRDSSNLEGIFKIIDKYNKVLICYGISHLANFIPNITEYLKEIETLKTITISNS